jgi:1,4-dihydroxy-2-naphthoate octaprenyltransferase
VVSIKAVAGVARAPFLLLPVTLVAAGAAAAWWGGDFSWLRTLVALVGLVSLHVAVNVFNEVGDFKSGIDLETTRTPFSGGSGTLPSGALNPVVGTRLGAFAAFIGLVAGYWFLSLVGWRLLPILVIGGLATLAYTDFLARHYVGEFFAGLGLGAMPVLGTAMVQGGRIGAAAVVAAIPAFLMTFNLLLLNEFPDEEADRAGGRRNLVLLLGRPGAARVYSMCALFVPVWLVGAYLLGFIPALSLAAVAPSLLLGKPLRWALSSPEREVPIPALGANVIWNLATNTLFALSLLAAGWLRF